MSVKLLTEHHLEFLSSKRGCTGLSESTLVKRPLCWKSHVVAQHVNIFIHFGAQKDNLIEVVLLSAHICFWVLTLRQFFCVGTAYLRFGREIRRIILKYIHIGTLTSGN